MSTISLQGFFRRLFRVSPLLSLADALAAGVLAAVVAAIIAWQ